LCSRCRVALSELNYGGTWDYVSKDGLVRVDLCSTCEGDGQKRWGSPEYGGVDWTDALGWPWYYPDVPPKAFLDWLGV
jgi:hypothetical protein